MYNVIHALKSRSKSNRHDPKPKTTRTHHRVVTRASLKGTGTSSKILDTYKCSEAIGTVQQVLAYTPDLKYGIEEEDGSKSTFRT